MGTDPIIALLFLFLFVANYQLPKDTLLWIVIIWNSLENLDSNTMTLAFQGDCPVFIQSQYRLYL